MESKGGHFLGEKSKGVETGKYMMREEQQTVLFKWREVCMICQEDGYGKSSLIKEQV